MSAFMLMAGGGYTANASSSFTLSKELANPFNMPLQGTSFTKAAFADIDGDGDLDCFLGERDGSIRYYKNKGGASTPSFEEITGSENPFHNKNVTNFAAPSFADIDGDGDLDAFIGEYSGIINYFKNQGDASVPSFVMTTGPDNPFNNFDAGEMSAPSFADIDNDNDLDLFVGNMSGNIKYFKNLGPDSSGSFSEIIGTHNPFNNIDVGVNSVPSFADIDGDGDLDALIGEGYANTVYYYKNQGSSTSPVFAAASVSENPFKDVSAGNTSAPTFADIDGDGDLDLFIGEETGILQYFVNHAGDTGSSFLKRTVDVGWESSPTFADIDGDGDLDCVIGEYDGGIYYYQNQGSATSPLLVEVKGKDNYFSGINLGYCSNPTFADINGDGDLDLVFGEAYGKVNYYENQGSLSSPSFSRVTGASDPFNNIDAGDYSAPTFADIDGDGDLDLVVGDSYGTIKYYNNTGTVPASYNEVTGIDNPFDGITGSTYNKPAFADNDGDGDLDLFMGGSDGAIRYYENQGTASEPSFKELTGAANPLAHVDTVSYSVPSFADIDGDGDLDFFAGKNDGSLIFYKKENGEASGGGGGCFIDSAVEPEKGLLHNLIKSIKSFFR